MVLCTTCNRSFASVAAYRQHARDKGHVFTASGPFCQPCGRMYVDQAALEQHWRDSSAHPTCTRCGTGWNDQAALTAHVDQAHKVQCPPCGRFIFLEDRQRHFNETASHPKCVICVTGFLDVEMRNQHVDAIHPETRCVSCDRFYAVKEALAAHYRDSRLHPTCAICRVGFAHSEAYDRHVSQVHPRSPSPSPSPVESVQSYVDVTPIQLDADPSQASQMQSLPASPLQFREESVEPSVMHEESTMDLRIETGFESSWHGVQRTASEPTLPSASSLRSVDTDELEDEPSQVTLDTSQVQATSVSDKAPLSVSAETPGQSPALSHRTLDSVCTNGQDTRLSMVLEPSSASQATYEYITYPDGHSEFRAETSLSISTVSTSLSSSESTSPVYEDELPSPANSVLAEMSPCERYDHLHPEAVAARSPQALKDLPPPTPQAVLGSMVASPSHSVAGGNMSNASVLSSVTETPARWAPVVKEVAVQVAEILDAVPPSPPVSASRRLSVASSIQTSHSTDKPQLSVNMQFTNGLRPQLASNDTDSTVQNVAYIAPPAATPSLPPVKGPSWHCRICMRNPCKDPTATMCGHIFCHDCIIKELSINMQCPVCRKTLLLRLFADAD